MKKVMIFGIFDEMHSGKRFFLEQAQNLGDHLIAVIIKDLDVRKKRGSFPTGTELKRKKNLESWKAADKVIVSAAGNPLSAISEFQPDVICLGPNQEEWEDEVQSELLINNIDAEIVKIPKKEVAEHSKVDVDELIGE